MEMVDSQSRCLISILRLLSSGETSRWTIRLGFFLHEGREALFKTWKTEGLGVKIHSSRLASSFLHEVGHVAEKGAVGLILSLFHHARVFQHLGGTHASRGNLIMVGHHWHNIKHVQ